MVERFFAEITRRRIRRGAFKSVAELKHAIMAYLDNHNADPKPFVRTKSAGHILKKGRKSETSVRVTTPAMSLKQARPTFRFGDFRARINAFWRKSLTPLSNGHSCVLGSGVRSLTLPLETIADIQFITRKIGGARAAD